MPKKSIFTKKTLILGAALLGGYVLIRKMGSPRLAAGEGALGGTDDLLEHQGFDIDPNSIPDQPDEYQKETIFYEITPEGEVVPSVAPIAGITGGLYPIASTGTGSLFQDSAAVGGAIGANLFLPSIAKRITKLYDTKYISDKVVKQTSFQKFVKDPYGISDLALSKAEKTGSREVAQLAIDKSGKTIIKTIPKWAKTTKAVANFIPLLDIPIGAGLDVYFSRYEEIESQKIDWWSAIKANTAGELAQLGVMGVGAAAGTVVPVAGNIAGGITGFVVGTGADIAATELYYRQIGKSSLFGTKKITTPTSPTPEPSQISAVSTSGAAYIAAATKQPYSAGQVYKQAAGITTPRVSTAPSVTRTTAARTTSISRPSAPRTAPKTSVVRRVASRVTKTVSRARTTVRSVASRVRSWFRR